MVSDVEKWANFVEVIPVRIIQEMNMVGVRHFSLAFGFVAVSNELSLLELGM
jgi:hypothetical protein